LIEKPIHIKLLALAFCCFLGACQSLKLSNDLGLLGLSDEARTDVQYGLVRAEHCGIRVMGFGTSADLTGATQDLRSRFGTLRYLTRVRIERHYKQYVVYERDCWVIRGLGYE